MHYLDTSVLAAYYIPEPKSAEVNRVLSGLENACISLLTEVEIASAISRRVRMNELSREDGERIQTQFRIHLENQLYRLLPLAGREYARAREWLSQFTPNLRTLDALHLAVVVSNQLTLVTADLPFASAAQELGVTVQTI